VKRKEEKTEFHVSCGNVFKDLGFENPDEALAKSRLARQIYKVIKHKKLTQKEAAKILGIDQPKVSDIIRGNLSKYSLDRLMRFVRMLGNGIEIRIKSHSKQKSRPKLEVYEEGASKLKDSQAKKPKVRRRKKPKVS